jgi:hypothetical protein
MLASELRNQIDALIALHGDREMLVDTGQELESIEEVDLDVEETGFVIWMG